MVSRFGDSLDAIAYSWMVYTLTGSASLTASTFAVNILVSVLLTPFSASLITGWSKKAVIVLCDVGRGLLVLMTALLFVAGWLQPWMIITITGLNSTLEAFRNPAGTAVFPQIVSKDKYTLAMSLSSALTRAMELIGVGLAGVIVGGLGVEWALIIDACTFFFSAAVLFTLKLPPHTKEAAGGVLKAFLTNTKDGFVYAVKNKTFMAICVTGCFINFAITPINALQSAYVSSALNLGAGALSVIGVSLSVGMGLGSICVPKIMGKLSRFLILLTGIAGIGLSFFSLAFLPLFAGFVLWALLAAVFFVLGIGAAFTNTVVQVSLMERIDEGYLARVSGIMTSLCLSAMPAASFLSAVLTGFLPLPHVMFVFGIFAIAGSLLVILAKPLRHL